jgi:hypothetical protein
MAEIKDDGFKPQLMTNSNDLDDEKIDRNPETNRLAYAQNMQTEEFLAAEKSLKRKLDVRLLALLWLIFLMNYLDRVRIRSCSLATTPLLIQCHRKISLLQRVCPTEQLDTPHVISF